MSNLTILGDTSGSVVLQAPAIAGSTTITMPAATGTMMVTGNMPAFSAWSSSQTSLSTSTFTKLIMNTKIFDTAGCFNNTGSTVTLNGISVPSYSFAPNVAGYYQINASNYINGTASNSVIGIYKNNVDYCYGAGIGGSANPYYQVACVVYFNGTSDYIHVGLYTGTAGLTSGNSTVYQFSGVLVRAA